ncbi:hypothetical protein [Legionella sainthelensi]|nr:hypothetical protein [Legionella sainthelensi]
MDFAQKNTISEAFYHLMGECGARVQVPMLLRVSPSLYDEMR